MRALIVLILALLVIQFSTSTVHGRTCSQSLQAQIDTAPSGSVVRALPCVYRESVSITKPLTLDGSNGAEIRGSDIWSVWTPNGSTWLSQLTVPSFPYEPTPTEDGRCGNTPTARCLYHEQVFIDGTAQYLITPGEIPQHGQFSLDSQRHIRLGSNPTGHLVEVSIRETWIWSAANGITIQNMRFKHAANHVQFPAIGNFGTSDWTLQDSTLSDTHSEVVMLSYPGNTKLLRNNIFRGGDGGVGGDRPQFGLVQGNHFHNNGTDEFNPGWGTEGLKFGGAHNMQIDSNQSDHNNGVGLWCDVGCTDISFTRNRVHHNTQAGIMFEISDGALIDNNVIWNNAVDQNNWVFTAGILTSSARNIEISHNITAWNPHSISVISQKRPDTPGPIIGVSVHDNSLIQLTVPSNDYWRNTSLTWVEEAALGTDMYAANNRGYANRFWYDTPENNWPVRFFFQTGWAQLAPAQADGRGFSPSDRYYSQSEAQHLLQTNGVP